MAEPAPLSAESDAPSGEGDAARVRWIIFSDDWGRHPSSCQHLMRQLLPTYDVTWVNTIGTRMPGLNLEDFKKVIAKLKQWSKPPEAGETLPDHLTVVTPRMVPGFRRSWQRKLNAKWISRAVNGALGPRTPGEQRVVVTTIPLTADLIRGDQNTRHVLDVDRWVYYCVDDFSVWPGLDASVMQDMEQLQAKRVDEAIVVSDTLQDRLEGMGRPSHMLTHGIDVNHWSPEKPDGASERESPLWTSMGLGDCSSPIFLFWGLIDTRLDVAFCKALAERLASDRSGTLVLVGPQQSPDPALADLPGIVMPGPADYADLPQLAACADVLVMPYNDLPVTRAMQPLKFKEYLATGKPVVARMLPATASWSDASDLVETPQAFVDTVLERANGGIPDVQVIARERLADESWENKARRFEQLVLGTG